MFDLVTKYKNYVVLIAILIFYIYFSFIGLPNPDNRVTICLFHNITGYPCGSCGTTRGIKYLFNGYFYEAFFMNPLAYVTVLFTVFAFCMVLYDIITNNNKFWTIINKKPHKIIIIAIVIFTIINWIWNIQKGL